MPWVPTGGNPSRRSDHSRRTLEIVFKVEPRMNTNRHKYRWTLLCCDDFMGRIPPGSAGVPPAQFFPQPRSSPPPGSTGNGARTLLRPSPCRSRRQGGRVPHRRETERHATGVHAGGTPALPGGATSNHSCSSRERAPACRAAVLPMRQIRPAWWPFVVLRVSSWITLFRLFQVAQDCIHQEKARAAPIRPRHQRVIDTNPL